MSGPVLVISNPKAGDGRGPAFVKECVLPLLVEHGVRVDKEIVTTTEGHAGSEVLKFINEHKKEPSVSLILASGDGTLHEIINAVYDTGLQQPVRTVQVALIPFGTANALYSSLFTSHLEVENSEAASVDYKLLSVKSLFRDHHTIKPLAITRTITRAPSQNVVSTSFSTVVVSTSLHASILHDSETLREQIPDLSRFKIAAKKNITRWYNGLIRLEPPKGSEVVIYDHHKSQFIPFAGDENNPAVLTMHGPFAYFLSTVNVDRLEPSFVISPLHSKMPPDPGAMDLIVIRPHRDPTIAKDSESDGDHLRFAEKLGLALHSAYRNGEHVDLIYTKDGTVQVGGGENSRGLVEYIRCGSWCWYNVRDIADWAVLLTNGACTQPQQYRTERMPIIYVWMGQYQVSRRGEVPNVKLLTQVQCTLVYLYEEYPIQPL